MKFGLLCIGDELLDGRTTNTNATWLGVRLSELGSTLHQVITVKDQVDEIAKGLKFLRNYNDFVITSGGIGPTEDDITVESIAHFFNQPMEIDSKELSRLKSLYESRNYPFQSNAERQAKKPSSARFITNPTGVASGVYWAREGILTLAGVPKEFQGIFEEFIKQHPEFNLSHLVKKPLVWNIFGKPEAELDLIARKLPRSPKSYPTYRIIYPFIEVRLMNEPDETIRNKWKEQFDPISFSTTQKETLEEVIIKLLREKNKKLFTVESCTGGMIAKRITDLAGVSDVFVGSIITYANELKEKIGVSEEVLKNFGAVSDETVIAMLEAGRNFVKPNDDLVCIAVSGIAGPSGGNEVKPVGTVHIGVSDSHQKIVRKFLFKGRDRDQIRLLAVASSLIMVLELLKTSK